MVQGPRSVYLLGLRRHSNECKDVVEMIGT